MPRMPAIPTYADALSPLDHQRREQLIDDLVRRAARANLTAPAILFLEMHKPLAFLGAQFLWAHSPFCLCGGITLMYGMLRACSKTPWAWTT